MKDKKRTLGLLAILGGLIVFAGPNIYNNYVLDKPTQKVSQSKEDSSIKITENKANANTKKTVDKNKLQIDNLISSTYTLQSLNEGNPFKSNSSNKNTTNNSSSKNNRSLENKPLPNTIPINGEQHIDNNISTRPSFSSNGQDNKQSGKVMLLKAIAQTNNKTIAVVESDGKRSTLFIGSSIDDFIVTDIDGGHVYMQNSNTGETKTLNLAS